jgi:hypothetical protein
MEIPEHSVYRFTTVDLSLSRGIVFYFHENSQQWRGVDENGKELTILGLAVMSRKEQTKVALPRSSSREVTFNIMN